MSSFVTNNNTRRTKRARVHNTRSSNSDSLIGSYIDKPFSDNAALTTLGRKPGLSTTIIGAHGAKGLVIMGGGAGDDFMHPENPDERDIHLGTSGTDSDKLANPAFPVSFSGPGYLSFQNEVDMPFIRGNMHVRGDMIIDGNLSYNNAGEIGAPVFAPVITDALGNELDGVIADSVYVSETLIDYFEAYITWTGSTALATDEALRLTGFPLSSYSLTSEPILTAQGGLVVSNVGGSFHVQVVTGQDYLLLEEIDNTAGTTPTPLSDWNLNAGAGSLHVTGWLRKA